MPASGTEKERKMLEILQYSMNAVFPIMLLIILGYNAKKSGMLDDQTIARVNRFNFRYGYFCLMFVNIYNVDLSEGLSLKMMALVLGILVLLTVIGWVASAFLTKEPSRRGVLIQASFRSNYAIIGMMMAQALAGDEAAALVAIFQLPAVLYFNSVSVLAMSIYSDSDKKPSVGSVIRSMAMNPLIRGILAALVCILARLVMPARPDGELVFSISGTLPWLLTTMTHLSRMATPLALICLGANLKISEAGDYMKELAGGIFLRLVSAPAIGFTIVYLADRAGVISVTPPIVAMLICVLGSPLATATAIMAKEMDADASLAGQLVVWTSVLSMGTLFIIVGLMRSIGWL